MDLVSRQPAWGFLESEKIGNNHPAQNAVGWK